MSDRARAAYAAYGESVGWKNFRGDPMPQFGELPEAIQTAWDAACGAALLHWCRNDFRTAANSDEHIHTCLSMIIIGRDQGADPMRCMRVAVVSLVAGLLDPEGINVIRQARAMARESGDQIDSN